MYKEITVQVTDILQTERDFIKLKTNGGARRAILYLSCCSAVEIGEYIKVNTTAETLGLGTGGWDFVTTTFQERNVVPGEGHIMKARYTPFQHSVFAIDSPEHPDQPIFRSPFSLQGKPVLLAELHSMLPIILLAVTNSYPRQKIGVILSDEASLAAGLSDHMTEWKNNAKIDIITTGQAFGGTEEAVTIADALQWLTIKKQVDIIVISMGPGTVGTGTAFGFSGMALSNWANIVGSLQGRPVWIPRLSFNDKRERHSGLSHHTITPLLQFTYAFSDIVFPRLDEQKDRKVEKQVRLLQKAEHVTLIYLNVEDKYFSWLNWHKHYTPSVYTMGTIVEENPDFIKGVLAPVKHILEG